jgi:hypothetical protein
MGKLLVPAVLLALLAGCGPSAKQVVAEKRGELEARIKLIDEFAGKVAAGTAARGELKLPDGVKLNSTGGPDTTALRMSLEDAQDKEAGLELAFGGGDLRLAREYLSGVEPYDADQASSTVNNLLQPRFLILMKTGSLVLPKTSGDGETFSSGSIEFEVYVLDMIESKELGALRGSATSDDKVEARTKYASDTETDLKSDLWTNADLAYQRLMQPFTK